MTVEEYFKQLAKKRKAIFRKDYASKVLAPDQKPFNDACDPEFVRDEFNQWKTFQSKK